jgi:hypothetical protein
MSYCVGLLKGKMTMAHFLPGTAEARILGLQQTQSLQRRCHVLQVPLADSQHIQGIGMIRLDFETLLREGCGRLKLARLQLLAAAVQDGFDINLFVRHRLYFLSLVFYTKAFYNKAF